MLTQLFSHTIKPSANCKQEILNYVSSLISKPLNMFMLTEAFNTISKHSTTIKSKDGETQSPYLKLLLNLNSVVGLPITRTPTIKQFLLIVNFRNQHNESETSTFYQLAISMKFIQLVKIKVIEYQHVSNTYFV